MLLVDLEEGRIVPDEEIKHTLAARQPYGEWLKENQITLEALPQPPRVYGFDPTTIVSRQRAFGYTEEDLRILLAPMATMAKSRWGRWATDTPLACLSDRPQPLFQLFQTAIRAGHQSGHRSDSRRAGDVAHQLHRHRAEHSRRDAEALPHAEAAASDPDESGS